MQRPGLLEAVTGEARAQQVRRNLIKGGFPLYMGEKNHDLIKVWRAVEEMFQREHG